MGRKASQGRKRRKHEIQHALGRWPGELLVRFARPAEARPEAEARGMRPEAKLLLCLFAWRLEASLQSLHKKARCKAEQDIETSEVERSLEV